MLRRTLVLALSATVGLPAAVTLLPAQAAPLPVPDPTVAAARQVDPVVLTGEAFGTWAVPSNVTAKAPLTDLFDCQSFDEQCEHNHYEDPEVDSSTLVAPEGTDVATLSGWKWDGSRFVEVPFQVDEVFTRYLDNSASGFAVYSGEDQHTTYAFDREGFRFTESSPTDPCQAVAASERAVDPIKGLDSNDEVVFMARDAGAQAPADALRPHGTTGVKQVTVVDPLTQQASYLYVMQGLAPTFDAGSGYVRYTRDANAGTFEKSESSYDNYGNAAAGPYCDADGNVVLKADGTPDVQRRRPRDLATVETDRYRYRYDGRWLMTDVRVKEDEATTYGADLVDRWKARAFQQDAESETPCCGYEEEDTNWGGSSTLLGERTGPVRTVRETWGADSGTNVIRRETFYRDDMVMKTWLRVHVIPPLDGIYAQWDYNAGVMTRHYNPNVPDGVAVDGRNDEVLGNFDDPCNAKYDANGTGGVTPDLPRGLPDGRRVLAAVPPELRRHRPDDEQARRGARLVGHRRPGRHHRRPVLLRADQRHPGRLRPERRGRALLPRRRLLRRRHRHEPRPAPQAAQRRRADDRPGHRPAAPLLDAGGRRGRQQHRLLPGRHRRARRAPAVPRRQRQRPADRPGDRDRVLAATGLPAR